MPASKEASLQPKQKTKEQLQKAIDEAKALKLSAEKALKSAVDEMDAYIIANDKPHDHGAMIKKYQEAQSQHRAKRMTRAQEVQEMLLGKKG